MKTLRTAKGSIIRVKDEDARAMVAGEGKYKEGEYTFCSKAEWKKEVRGPVKKAAVKEEVEEKAKEE